MPFFIGAGTSAVGGLLNTIGAIQSRNAMDAAFRNELARQAGYARQGQAALQPAIAGSSAPVAQQQMGQGAANRMAEYNSLAGIPLGLPTGSDPHAARDLAYSGMLGQNRANLGSYSDWALQQAIQNINTQRALNQISNFAAGTANVFPYKMYDASHAGDLMGTIGQAISGLGKTASAFGYYNQMSQPPDVMNAQGYSIPYGGQRAPAPGFYLPEQTPPTFMGGMDYNSLNYGGYMPMWTPG